MSESSRRVPVEKNCRSASFELAQSKRNRYWFCCGNHLCPVNSTYDMRGVFRESEREKKLSSAGFEPAQSKGNRFRFCRGCGDNPLRSGRSESWAHELPKSCPRVNVKMRWDICQQVLIPHHSRSGTSLLWLFKIDLDQPWVNVKGGFNCPVMLTIWLGKTGQDGCLEYESRTSCIDSRIT